MNRDDAFLYSPLDVLKPVAADLWIVDGPAIRFGPPWPKILFPTRMTIVRLSDGRLFVHSPTPPTPTLVAEIANIGAPRWIVAPNFLHRRWIPAWKAAFPGAEVYLAPGTRKRMPAGIDFDCLPLEAESGFPWDDEIATLPIVGSYLTEVEFFHRASRTLVLTDLIENFEPKKLHSLAMRWVTRLGGVQDPDGRTPRDMRLTFLRNRPQLRRALERMIAWAPERVILAHGRWYRRDGMAELRRALRWALR